MFPQRRALHLDRLGNVTADHTRIRSQWRRVLPQIGLTYEVGFPIAMQIIALYSVFGPTMALAEIENKSGAAEMGQFFFSYGLFWDGERQI